MPEPVDEFMGKIVAMAKINPDYRSLLKVILDEERIYQEEHMVQVYKGWVLANLGEYGEAERAFNKAVELNPKSAWAYFRKGQMLREQGKYQEALDCLTKAVKIKPNRPDFWVEKGQVEDELDMVSDSYASYEAGIRLGDKSGWGWAGKSRILTYLNRLEEALDAIRVAIKLNPGEGEFRKFESLIIDKIAGY